jgi:hypothetical protein
MQLRSHRTRLPARLYAKVFCSRPVRLPSISECLRQHLRNGVLSGAVRLTLSLSLGLFGIDAPIWNPISTSMLSKQTLTRDMPNGRLSRMSKRKNPAAVKLGALGGKARGRKASKKRLSEIGREGAAARWKETTKSKRP